MSFLCMKVTINTYQNQWLYNVAEIWNNVAMKCATRQLVVVEVHGKKQSSKKTNFLCYFLETFYYFHKKLW